MFTIFSGMIGGIYFLGVWTSLKFDWLQPAIPYFHAFIVCGVLLWMAALVMDYVAVRRAAFTKPVQVPQIDFDAKINVEKRERIYAVEELAKQHYQAMQRIEQSISNLTPKPKSLKLRTIELANELFTLQGQLGPEPPNAFAGKTLAEQRGNFNSYFDWHRARFYRYMAYFRDRVVSIDYELAAHEVMTKLSDNEIDPPSSSGDVDLAKIAQALLVAGNAIADEQAKLSA
jgi:hypothetical protein